MQGAQQQTACSVSCPPATAMIAVPASQAGTSRAALALLWLSALCDCTLAPTAAKQTLSRTTSGTYRVFGQRLAAQLYKEKQIEKHNLDGFRGKKQGRSMEEYRTLPCIPETSATLQVYSRLPV